MRKAIPFVALFCMLFTGVRAQNGSQHTFQFLNLAVSPRAASIGSDFLPLDDHDLLLALHNPALVNSHMHHHLGFSFLDHLAGIKAGNVVYSRTFEKYGSFLGGIRFLHYGTFDRTDPSGADLGSFSASDVALTMGWGRVLHPGFTMGANLNLILSSYDVYSSFALATDVAFHYKNKQERFQASLLFRNIGRQISSFGSVREDLPFEVAGGFSAKLTHAPLRFYVLLNEMQVWDLSYHDPLNPSFTIDPFTGIAREPGKTASYLDKAMRHVVGGVEFMPGDFLRLRVGYDYRSRQESGIQSKMGLVGFSWGLGLRFGKYYFDFSRSRMHLAGAPNVFSVRTDLSHFTKKHQ